MADTFESIGAAAVNVVAQVPLFRRYPGVARVLANRMARKAVERQLQADGVRLYSVPCAKMRELALAYLEAHPTLQDHAAEIVASDPKLRALAEADERRRERARRKWRRKSGLLDRQNPSVT